MKYIKVFIVSYISILIVVFIANSILKLPLSFVFLNPLIGSVFFTMFTDELIK